MVCLLTTLDLVLALDVGADLLDVVRVLSPFLSGGGVGRSEEELHEGDEVVPAAEEHDGEGEEDREEEAAVDDEEDRWIDAVVG